ncbi:hypothetical protein BKA70DRAFT_1471279 [Coprinopsis sp. MPI-PUGE-AT-0042]|nr:hypothetical protein BKA70DRAFT_1471279 [Coprinopsis sp. MPI-PUGE-AT-0042]
MQLSSIAIMIFVTPVFAAPTESLFGSGLRMRGEVDQGDGFYLAVFHNGTDVADVQFTALAELASTEGVTTPATVNTSLLKRGTTCSGRRSINLNDLNNANVQLANNANAQGSYGKGANGWVHLGGETSFFCNYQANFLTYGLIIDMHTVVSHYCGQDGYGYDRRTNGGGANDLAVGRTFRGDGFC